jgi:RimJ/RimL family protein N-acetyltransferase
MEQPDEYLYSGQVELRRWRVSDVDTLDQVISESLDHLLPWTPWAADLDRKQVAAYLSRCEEDWDSGRAYNYAIASGGAVVGSCGLMRRSGVGGLDVGYWLHPGWTGRGLATMATAALVRQGLQLVGITRIEIHHDEANHASGAVARRLGFTQVRRVRMPEGPAAPGEAGIDVVWEFRSQ